MAEPTKVICTFCANSTTGLIMGNDPKMSKHAPVPAVYICRQCVVLCCELLGIDLATPRRKLDFWKVLVRVAPKVKLQTLSDALFDQGFVLDFVMEPNEPAPPASVEDGGTNG